MKKAKKLLCMLLAALLVAGCLPMAASAYDYGQCTYVAYKQALNRTGISLEGWGHASTWYESAKNAKYTVLGADNIPPAESIICWGGGLEGMGHVAYITNANANGAQVIEGNYTDKNGNWYAEIEHWQTWEQLKARYAIDKWGNRYNQWIQGYICLGNGSVNLGAEFYAAIINTASWLHASNEGNVVGRKNTGQSSLIWRFQRLSDGSYKITSVIDGKCLDAKNSGTNNGTNVQVYKDNGSDAQKWKITGSSGAYYFSPKYTNLVLDFASSSYNDGTNIQLWTKNYSEAQKLQIWPITGVSKLSCSVKGNKAEFSWEKDYRATVYNLRILKNGKSYKDVWNINNLKQSVELEAGTYQAYTDACNMFGYVQKSNTVTFTVEKSAPSDTTLKLSFYTSTFTKIPALTSTDSSSSKTFIIPTTKPQKDGYTFLGWSTSSNAATASYQPGDSITITKNTTLYAVWKKNSTTYTLSFDTGTSEKIPSVTVADEKAEKIFTVPTTVPTRDGYSFLGWNTRRNAATVSVWPGNTVTVNGNTTLYAVWQKLGEEPPENPDEETPDSPSENITINIYIVNFIDVVDNAYYSDAVGWAVQNQITSGTSDTTFSPNTACTRAQAVTFLWRAAGSPEPSSLENPFTDVKASDYYYRAVLWAVENGVTSGTSATTFSPNAKCSRAQIVTFQWRAAGSPSTSVASFADVSVGQYYEEAVAWAVEAGITSGTGNNNFSPEQNCTRAQIVTFLYRAYA